MSSPARHRRAALALACATGLAAAVASSATATPSPRADGDGGAPVGGVGLDPTNPHLKVPAPPSRHARGHWLGRTTITQYWPAPEAWFVGRLVSAPGLTGLHHIDWLYSASGMSMEGDGIGLDGRLYHIDALGDGGWVTQQGRSTSAASGFSRGAPYWRAGGYWRNRTGGVTFPLAAGGWARGRGRRYVPLRGVSFAAGNSKPLRYLRSVAVDPDVIPLGSRVYVPAYRHDGYGGWFIAADTGGAIRGHHIDVYRAPPTSSLDAGETLIGKRIFVIPARRRHG